ncbi:MAG: glutamate--tRNA ligase [Anaerolineae bacterium]|nr:glutamate--tRNA ligase [Anaerolineae bacterium]
MTDANRPVRTRFAPSPTGSLHIGGLRMALWAWLFARHHGGQFILRIEDTDQKRYDPNALQTLLEALRWVGVDWDEGPEVGGPYGPYVQSERLALYQEWAKWLVDNDHAYYCYCSSERLEQVNKEKQAAGIPPGYDRRCRYASPDELAAFKAEAEADGRSPVIRLKMPREGKTLFPDLVRGEVEFENESIQDAVLLKGDGFPTYHLAVVVDDHFMRISHVMRGIEWLPSAPLHMQLWKAFGWEMPQYAHLPVMLNPNGKGKISKRKPPVDTKGNVLPVMVHDYIKGGYLAPALANLLVGIGWNFGDEVEVFSMDEARERFNDFSRINPSNSAFPMEKLEWINGLYIREKMTPDALADALRAPLEAAGLNVDMETLRKVAPLVQTRIKTLNDVVDMAGFFFKPEFTPPPVEKLIQKKMDAASTKRALEACIPVIEAVDPFTADKLLGAFTELGQELGLNNSQMFGVLRVAVSGQAISTPTFETMEIVGREETLRRVRLAIGLVS